MLEKIKYMFSRKQSQQNFFCLIKKEIFFPEINTDYQISDLAKAMGALEGEILFKKCFLPFPPFEGLEITNHLLNQDNEETIEFYESGRISKVTFCLSSNSFSCIVKPETVTTESLIGPCLLKHIDAGWQSMFTWRKISEIKIEESLSKWQSELIDTPVPHEKQELERISQKYRASKKPFQHIR